MKIPTVIATRYEGRQSKGLDYLIVERCPYCQKRHYHAWPQGDPPPVGRHRAKCGVNRFYRVAWGGLEADEFFTQVGGGRARDLRSIDT